jgi:hypothetical protein
MSPEVGLALARDRTSRFRAEAEAARLAQAARLANVARPAVSLRAGRSGSPRR